MSILKRTIIFLPLILFVTLQGFSQKKCYNLLLVLARPPHPQYAPHLITARGYGIRILENQAQINQYIKAKKIVTIGSGRGYSIHTLTHSRACLVPKARKVLGEIGSTFYQRSKRKTCTITSITRTLEDQCRLRRINGNATSGASSHNYACSFDISYIRFSKSKRPDARLEAILQNILTDMQNRGKLYFIKERKEKCFHITVRSR